MTPAIRQRLVAAAQDVRMREVLIFLYRDHPQGASCEGLKEMLCLHEDFQDAHLQQLAKDHVLTFDGSRYQISADARQILDRDPIILLDAFLR